MSILNIICNVMAHFHRTSDGVVTRDLAQGLAYTRFGTLEDRGGESCLATSLGNYAKLISVQCAELYQ
jgi:hypothetical protein